MFNRLKTFVVSAALLLASTLTYAAEHPAQLMIEDAVTSILQVYTENGERLKSDPAFLRSEVQRLIVPHVDWRLMTVGALKKYWRRADKNQQEELVAEFKTLLLNTYTSAFTEYSGDSIDGDSIKFEPFRPGDKEDRAEVRSRFVQASGDDVPVIYKVTNKGDDSTWLIYDIEVNNIGLSASYRSAFANEIEKDGIDGLIKTLKERNGSS